MASIFNRGGLAFALIVLIVTSSFFDTTIVADARRAKRCEEDNPVQSEIPGCPGSGGGSEPKPGPPSGPAPGSSRCKRGCCGRDKMGDCICCK